MTRTSSAGTSHHVNAFASPDIPGMIIDGKIVGEFFAS
jgi:hypothetical protein